MSYDAVALSSTDLSAGYDFFRQTDHNSFPWVAANIYNQNSERPFSPYIIKKIDRLTIGIIGLTGDVGNSIGDFVINDWRIALQKELPLLEERCDVLIVLSTLSSLENRELQQDYNQIDIIVAADPKQTNLPPKILESSLLTQSGGRGKYLGKLDITWNGGGKWLVASSDFSAQVKSRLRSIESQLFQLEKRQRETKKDLSKRIELLRSYRKDIADQIAQHPDLESVERENEPSKSFKSSFLAVKPSSSKNTIDSIVENIKKDINQFNRNRREAPPIDPPVRSTPSKNTFVGSSSCSKCHKKQTEFWKTTRHAKAYHTLSSRGQSSNIQCLPCHVTAGKVTSASTESEKLVLLSLRAEWQSIGCEACHGPGYRHLRSSDAYRPVRRPAEKVCIQCHTSERDDNFDYQIKLLAITCPVS